MKVHRYESTQQEVNETKGPVIFLAGPTVRGNQQHLQPSWRFEAIEIYKKAGFEGSLIVPEFVDIAESDKGKLDLPEWEYNGLKRADSVIVWIPITRELIGLTTNFEHGYWMARNITKVIYGRPDGSFRNSYTDVMHEKIHRELGLKSTVYNTLADVINLSIRVAEVNASVRKLHIERYGNTPDQTARL